jgi:hypothetical protein
MPFPSFDLLASIIAAWPTNTGGVDRLAIHKACTRLRLTPQLDPLPLASRRMALLPDLLESPLAAIVRHRFPRGKIMREPSPGTAAPNHRENRLQDAAPAMLAWSATPLRGREQGPQNGPFHFG